MRATTIRRDEMTTIRRAFAALFLTALLLILMAGPARAVQVEIQTADGERPGDDALKQTFQSMETAIHNQAAAWKASFQFVSDFDDDLEVTCAFRLGQDETIDGFAYWNGEEKIVGEVLEKQAATEIYQKLTGVRRDPGILEQEGSTFRFRVYPVLPGETKPVELTGMSILEVREGVVEYTIPRENLPGEDAVFSLALDVTDDLPIADVETLGFDGIVKRFGPRHVRVVYEDDGAAPDEDLRIRYRLDQDDYALRLIAHRSGDADGSFMLLVSPKQDADVSDVIGRDIVFVVDRSGSMDGVPLEQTKRALSFILDNLSRDDRFDVIAFDDENRVLFGSLQDATRKNRRLAIDEVEALESGGGTNIRDALMAALDELHEEKSDRARAIIFLTDGQGNNPPEVVLAEVRKRANGARIFPIGAGNGVNRRFLERLATDNRGLPTFVQNERRIEEEMRALYERIAMPLMVDLELSFEGVTVNSIYPKRLPDLYRDGQVVVAGRYSNPGDGKVILHGRLKGKDKQIVVPFEFPEEEERYAHVEKLWAGRRIEHLMDPVRTRHDDELVREVTRLGIVYNLVTEYTTFLAVPESLKTADIKDKIRQGKPGYTKKLIDGMEGIRLSQANIPPGDPVLSVAAPADAQNVTAYFPFGLVKALRYDEIRGHWSVRFLVPRDVPDGTYIIRVRIVHADGRVEWKSVEYAIDATAPEFEAHVAPWAYPGSLLLIEVDPFEAVRGVYAYLPDYDDERIPLTINPETGLYEGELPLPDVFENGRVRIRIVVRDLARNRFEQTLTVYENEAALSAAASEGDPEAQRMDTCAKRPSPQIVLALR